MYNVVSTLAPSFLIGSSSFLSVTETTIKYRISSKFDPIGPRTAELAALERLEKYTFTYNGRNVVSILAPSVLIGSSSCRYQRVDLCGIHVMVKSNIHSHSFSVKASSSCA